MRKSVRVLFVAVFVSLCVGCNENMPVETDRSMDGKEKVNTLCAQDNSEDQQATHEYDFYDKHTQFVNVFYEHCIEYIEVAKYEATTIGEIADDMIFYGMVNAMEETNIAYDDIPFWTIKEFVAFRKPYATQNDMYRSLISDLFDDEKIDEYTYCESKNLILLSQEDLENDTRIFYEELLSYPEGVYKDNGLALSSIWCSSAELSYKSKAMNLCKLARQHGLEAPSGPTVDGIDWTNVAGWDATGLCVGGLPAAAVCSAVALIYEVTKDFF